MSASSEACEAEVLQVNTPEHKVEGQEERKTHYLDLKQINYLLVLARRASITHIADATQRTAWGAELFQIQRYKQSHKGSISPEETV